MIKLLQTFLGLIFFGCMLVVLWVKSQPNNYQVSLQRNLSYPSASYEDYLRSEEGVHYWTQSPTQKDHLIKWLPIESDENSIYFELEHQQGFKITERWSFSENQKTLLLSYDFILPFLSKALLLKDSSFISTLKGIMLNRFDQLNKDINNRFTDHRWEYVGETNHPLTYYLALEGVCNWNDLTAEYRKAQKKILSFAEKNAIPTQVSTFLVLPKLLEDRVYWRAGVGVNQFYKTKNETIKCRRYKGGKTLQLVHKGPKDRLKESWKILFDSLQGNTQSYPVFLKEHISIHTTDNPLEWETNLYLPIQ